MLHIACVFRILRRCCRLLCVRGNAHPGPVLVVITSWLVPLFLCAAVPLLYHGDTCSIPFWKALFSFFLMQLKFSKLLRVNTLSPMYKEETLSSSKCPFDINYMLFITYCYFVCKCQRDSVCGQLGLELGLRKTSTTFLLFVQNERN